MSPHPSPAHGISFPEAVRVWIRIGLNSFGGPAGQIAVMHRVLVEERRWIGEARFLYALNYCMLLPGPEAQQLATYIGWLLHGTRGGLVAGTLFVLPGFLSIMALSWMYVLLGDVALVEGVFFGLKAAVLAVVVEAVVRIGRRALASRAAFALAGAAFVAIFAFAVPFPVVVASAAAVGAVAARFVPGLFAPAGHGSAGGKKSPGAPESGIADAILDSGSAPSPSLGRALRVLGVGGALWFGPTLALAATLGWDSLFVREAVFFSKAAVVTFGGAYAVLGYVAQEAVATHGWIAPGQMLDGLGMAETTPGPLIMVVQFVGFMGGWNQPGDLPPLASATLAAVLTTWVTFVPCFLWIFLGAPYVEKLRGNRALGSALAAVTAAVAGVILNLAVWFALHVAFAEVGELRGRVGAIPWPVWTTLDPAAAVIALAAFGMLFGAKLGMMKTLAACCAAGAAWRMLAA